MQKPTKEDKIQKNTADLLEAIVNENLIEIQRLLPVSDTTTLRCCEPLHKAVEQGNKEIVKLLIPVSDPKTDESYALRLAVEYEHIDIVKLLIPVSDPTAQESWALRWAANIGHIECVKLLVPVSDPKAHDGAALRLAVNNGHTEIVKILLPVSDPKIENNICLLQAVKQQHIDIIKLLIPVTDYQKVLHFLKYQDTTVFEQCIQEHETLLQKDRLTQQLNKTIEHVQKTNKRKI